MMIIESPYQANPKQRLFHDAITKYRWYFGGIGSGKTAALVTEHLTLCLEYPKTRSAIIAPTYKMVKNIDVHEFLKFCPKELIAPNGYNKAELRITLINGSEIFFFGADTESHIDKLRGLTLSHISIDEIGLLDEYIFKIIIGRLREMNGCLKGMFAGSPKGRNWVYTRLVEEAEKYKGTDTWIHTTTYDNQENLPGAYIQDLETQYVGDFKKQELYGEFISAEGLVYPSFSRHKHLFEGGEFKFKEVIAGVDFGFVNPSVILVIGLDFDNRLWIIDEFYERNVLIDDLIRNAKELKDKYNIQRFIADPSEPQFIQMFRNAGLQTLEAINDVIPGIAKVSTYLEVQKDSKPRLFLRKNCINTLMEFEMYRYPDKKIGREFNEKPLKIYDHCLIGSTLVATDKGQIPIKDVQVGDYVITRKGWKKVLSSRLTKTNAELWKVSLSNGNHIIGTSNHPIWVKNKGFTRIDALRNKYKLLSIEHNQWYLKRKLQLMELFLGDTTRKDILSPMDSIPIKDYTHSTNTCGKNIMEKYQTVMRSTTKILMQPIMTLPTWNVFQQLNMESAIADDAAPVKKNIWQKLDSWQLNGINLQQDVIGIKNIGFDLLARKEMLLRKIVKYVQSNFLTNQSTKQANSVLENAKHSIGEIHIQKVSKLKRRADVYNLDVEDVPEFYANGILVHNSMDALRYATMSVKHERPFIGIRGK